MLIKTENERYNLCKNISLILPETFGENVEKNFSLPNSFGNSKKKELMEEISEERIIKDLKNVKSLVLELTQNCNLRCKYCTFTGLYQSKRTHLPKMMPLQTAKKAIAFFFEHINSPFRSLKEPVIISYFGGEPLLETKILLDSVRYAKEVNNRKFGLQFIMTTNGLLLTEEIAKELVQEDFSLDFSLDGPEEEHDRFRVTASGKGSFKAILKNILSLENNFPEYFKKRVRFFITLHPYHDIKKLEEFFLINDHLFNELNVRINSVNINYYLRENEKKLWQKARREQYKKACTQLQKDKWFYKKQFADPVEQHLDRTETRLLSQTPVSSFTGTCFPGGIKLFVDVNGQFHICEKMNEDFFIGDVNNGYNIRNIKDIVGQWRQEIIKRECWDCDAWHMCTFCFANNSRNEKFSIREKDCQQFRKNLKQLLKDYLAVKENEDEEKNNLSGANMPDFLDTLQ